MILAHPGGPLAPPDLWLAWNVDPLLVGGLLLAAAAYRSGQARSGWPAAHAWRRRCFTLALGALGVALLSPLDALAGALASAHMVQHLLLVLVAAPLLALSRPWTALVRGSPAALRRITGRWRRRLRLTRGSTRALRHPGTAWLLHVGTLWFWHAAVPYGAALEHEIVHLLEHASFLLTGILFWGVVTGTQRRGQTSPGFGILFVFAAAMQGVFLSALLTFAGTPWYAGYAETTTSWHLEPLEDQQLAGLLMWIPGGLVYLAAALALLVTWIRRSEHEDAAPSSPSAATQLR